MQDPKGAWTKQNKATWPNRTGQGTGLGTGQGQEREQDRTGLGTGQDRTGKGLGMKQEVMEEEVGWEVKEMRL